MTPTGTPGTYGWSLTDADVTSWSPGLSAAAELSICKCISPPPPLAVLPAPVTHAELAARRDLRTYADGRGVVASSTVPCWRSPTSPRRPGPAPFSTVSSGWTPLALPASSVTVCWKPGADRDHGRRHDAVPARARRPAAACAAGAYSDLLSCSRLSSARSLATCSCKLLDLSAGRARAGEESGHRAGRVLCSAEYRRSRRCARPAGRRCEPSA